MTRAKSHTSLLASATFSTIKTVTKAELLEKAKATNLNPGIGIAFKELGLQSHHPNKNARRTTCNR
jgi:hypothetical protein